MIEGSWNSYKTVTIAAGGDRVVNVTGSVFKCVDSTTAFQVSYNGAEYFSMNAGLGFRLAPGDSYKELRFQNPSAQEITVKFYAGSLDITDDRPGRQNASTYLVGAGIEGIAAGLTVTFTGTDSLGNPRKSILITNLSAADDIEVYDSVPALAATVPAGKSWILEVGGTVKVKNPNATDIACNICEVFYSL